MKMAPLFTITLQMDPGTATMDRGVVLVETMDSGSMLMDTMAKVIMVMETI